MRMFGMLLGLTLACSTLACSSARFVRETKTGGTVALRGPRDGAQEKAEKLMRLKCPNGYEIVEQGEVAYGSVVHHSQDTSQRPGFWGPRVQTQSTTRQENQTEWQIIFECAQSAERASAQRYVITF